MQVMYSEFSVIRSLSVILGTVSPSSLHVFYLRFEIPDFFKLQSI